MNSLKPLLAIIALLLSFSCSSTKEENVQIEANSFRTIVIDDIPVLEDAKLTDLISDYEYIPLETSEESLVGQIINIEIDKDRIFIKEFNETGIHIFDRQGKFINKIFAKGNGPGEFKSVSSFTLNKEKRRLILSGDSKIMTFDYEGRFVNEFKINIGMRQIGYTGSDKLLIYSSYSSFPRSIIDSVYYQTITVDLITQKTVQKAIPFSPMSSSGYTGFWRNISSANTSGKYLSVPYNDTIWYGVNDSIQKAFVLDFGENGLPRNYEKEYISNPKYTSGLLRETETRNNWRKLSGAGVTHNKNMLYFFYSEKGKFPKVFYDLNTHKSFQVKGSIINDLDGFNLTAQYSGYDGKFVSYIHPSTLKKNLAGGKITEKRIIELAEGLKEEDNPVLRLLTFKPIQ